jgi:hypothetical protein
LHSGLGDGPVARVRLPAQWSMHGTHRHIGAHSLRACVCVCVFVCVCVCLCVLTHACALCMTYDTLVCVCMPSTYRTLGPLRAWSLWASSRRRK